MAYLIVIPVILVASPRIQKWVDKNIK
jgi:hypothetical protein